MMRPYRRAVVIARALIAAIFILTPVAAPAEPTPKERDLGTAEILKETAKPHPYAKELRRLVLGTMAPGSPWGTYRDPEDGRRYVGADACRPCHAERFRTWADTKMTGALKKLADFKGGLFLNDLRCLSCHTTGFDPGLDNGGFDEGIGAMAGVQCEACHGAGSLMVERLDRRFIIRAMDADLCGRCHSERYGTGLCFPEWDEWRVSRHAQALLTLRGSLDAADECLECHSADAVAPGGRYVGLALAGQGVTCQACHDAMARTYPDLADNNQLRRPKDELCRWCHSDGRRLSGDLPHSPQAEMFAGRGGAEVAGESYGNGPMNAEISRGCLTCHAVSDRSVSQPYQGHAFKANILACRRCHPDLESFNRKDVQESIRRLMLKLDERLKSYPEAKSEDRACRLAKFNLDFVRRDRSFGIHNSDYARKLLVDSLRLLESPQSSPR